MLPIVAFQNVPEEAFRVDGYIVVHWRHDDIGRVFVKDRYGRIVVQASEFNVIPEKVGDLDGDGHEDLLLETWTVGAHASFGYYLIGLGPQPKCMLAYWKGNGEGDKDEDLRLKDLDGDGKPEILSTYDGFSYRLGDGYAPLDIPLLLTLRHGLYVEAAARYPDTIRPWARTSLNRLIATERGPERREIESRVAATGFLALKMLLREEANGWRVVRQHVPPSVYRSLRRRRSWIHKAIEDRKLRVRHPALTKIPLGWNDLHDEDEWEGDNE